MSDPHFGRLKSLVLDATGLAYYADKDTVLADRIGRRLDQLGFGDCLTYFELVSEGILGEREFDALIAELTVGETFFFRYPKQFDALRDT
ncbi:MAG TPA: protein-glutamate O-methyltransferase CheR, partial [Rhodospirillales bacterium]